MEQAEVIYNIPRPNKTAENRFWSHQRDSTPEKLAVKTHMHNRFQALNDYKKNSRQEEFKFVQFLSTAFRFWNMNIKIAHAKT